jgi:hypothetical protein
MGWALNSQPLKQPELLNEFFVIVGKALYLASAFEAKCRYVLRIVNVAEYAENGGDLADTGALAAVLKAKLLGSIIRDMSGFPDFDAEDVALLERAKDARNFIAHESANLGWPLSGVSARHIRVSLVRLRHEVEALTAGDNLISRWVFEIEQREPAPWGLQQEYPQWVRQWIFGVIDSGLITEASEDKRTLAEKL